MLVRNRTYSIPRSIEDSRSIFEDLNLYGQYHPLIISVKELEAQVQNRKFEIIERPFRFLPLTISYTVFLLNEEGSTIYQLEGIPLTSARILYQYKELTSLETEINFNLQISSIKIVEKLLSWKMMNAQDYLFDSLNESLSD